MPIDDGGRVFPTHESDYEGMTFREYAAVKAMAAIISKIPVRGNDPGPDPLLGLPDDSETMQKVYRRVATGAVRYAEALIARLKTPAPEEAP